MSVAWCWLMGMEELFHVTLDAESMAALGLFPDEPAAGSTEPVDPRADDFDAFFRVIAQAAWDPVREGIERIAALRRAMSALQAEEQRELAVLARSTRAAVPTGPEWHREVEWAERSLIHELALAARVSPRTMAARVTEAETVASCFPHTADALAVGSITIGHVRVIVEHGLAIADAEARAAYEQAVLDRAIEVAPGRLRRTAQRAAARLAEGSQQERHDRARAERSVRIGELPDGMSEIVHTLPSVLAQGVWDRLTEQSRALKAAGDPRSLDQLRADLAAQLLLAGEASGCPDADGLEHIRAEVSIVVPALSLLGEGDEPAAIAGKGPIDLATAARLAAAAPQLVRVITHPISGLVIAADTYRPSESLRRYLRARDGRCRFPSCNRPAHRCEIDHTVAWQHGGKTTPDNLACLCPGHHTLKHWRGWRVRQRAPGILEWITPHGVIVSDVPDTPVRFAA